jgi:hypothetical protein
VSFDETPCQIMSVSLQFYNTFSKTYSVVKKGNFKTFGWNEHPMTGFEVSVVNILFFGHVVCSIQYDIKL